MLTTPVLLICFNRPDHTRSVLREILKACPERLYIAQDGARAGNASDAQVCALTRDAIDAELNEYKQKKAIEVKTRYSEVNQGCGSGPANAITWFFEHEEQGIIFEDDCMPSPTLLRFYTELLEKYKNDDSIIMITGTQILSRWKCGRGDYFKSKTGAASMGSWASWRRAWNNFDINIESWKSEDVKSQVKQFIGKKDYAIYAPLFDVISKEKEHDAWDYQWNLTGWIKKQYILVSTVNQMSNIGFGEESTHTDDATDKRANMERYECHFPLKCVSKRNDGVYDWYVRYKFLYYETKSYMLRALLKIVGTIYQR